MTHEHPVILVVDDHVPEETREMLQSELNRKGIGHILIVALAGLVATSSRMQDLIEDLGRLRITMPNISPAILAARDHFDAAPLPAYYQRFSTRTRMADNNLAAQYNHRAKWGSGAHNAGHRSRENRHAEAKRNAAAFNRRYNKS